jgi:hypothetical protein
MRPGRNPPSSLEDAAAYISSGMETARRCRESLPELRERERCLLREWAEENGCLLAQDPTLKLDRRKAHGEHVVGFDPTMGIWWKTTHPGTAGVGAEFSYESLPPFSILGIFARELLPSEYLSRMMLQNREFSDDVRLEGYLDQSAPSIVISQPDIEGDPATAEQMIFQMKELGYRSLGNLQIGKPNSISFYNPENRIAMFDAHPGNFFHHDNLTIPIDGIISEIPGDSEHSWLMNHLNA